MDQKKLDSVVLSPLVCLADFLSLVLTLYHKIHKARNVFLLSVFSITVKINAKKKIDRNTQDLAGVFFYIAIGSYNIVLKPPAYEANDLGNAI